MENPELSDAQKTDLDRFLAKHADVVSEETGKSLLHLSCHRYWHNNTHQDLPIQTAPAWRNQLREEIRSLSEAGILKPFLSPRSSPMVLVRKPDGSVQLCINYRKVNHVTKRDPYHMPRSTNFSINLARLHYPYCI